MKVLIAVDGTAGSRSVLTVFKTLTREPFRAVLVHVQRSDQKTAIDSPGGNATRVHVPEGGGAMQPECDTLVRFYREELQRNCPTEVSVMVRQGNPSEEILRAANEENVDMIILGSSRTSVLRPSAGRVAADVERHAAVPVLVAKKNRIKKFIVYNWRGKENAA